MTNKKTLCEYLGGSQLYHLDTPESDVDERGVFMHLDAAYVLGTKRFDEERKQNDEQDKVLKELSHFCSLLRKSNSEAMEVIFCKNSEFSVLTPEFKELRHHAYSWVDSKNLFNCLRGYIKGELRLACGERKGKIGGKRYAKLQEVGFSPKNFVQLFRLASVGREFFNTGEYLVDTRDMGNHEFLMEVKTQPENFTVEQLKLVAAEYEKQLVSAYENRKETFTFNEEKLNNVLLEIYFPVLQNKYEQLKQDKQNG